MPGELVKLIRYGESDYKLCGYSISNEINKKCYFCNSLIEGAVLKNIDRYAHEKCANNTIQLTY
jgi:hypothetical protein